MIPKEHERTIKVFVDGSYSRIYDKAGWGWVAVFDDFAVEEDYGVVENHLGSRNIAGELHAATRGITWAIEEGLPKIVLVHDYLGISHWANGLWKARTEIAQGYVVFMRHAMREIRITFIKIKGHSNNRWNDYADALSTKYKEEINAVES